MFIEETLNLAAKRCINLLEFDRIPWANNNCVTFIPAKVELSTSRLITVTFPPVVFVAFTTAFGVVEFLLVVLRLKWKTNGRTNGKNLLFSDVELVVTLVDLEVTLPTISVVLLDNAKQQAGSKTHSINNRHNFIADGYQK